MKLNAVFGEDLNEIEEQLGSMEENDVNYDMIAPNTQNTELQDEAEGAQDLHPYLTKRFDLSEYIGTPSTTANTQQLILNEVPDDEYRNIIQTLNKEQKEFFYHVLHPMKTSNNPFYGFLSGGAGVGKLHITKALYQAALKYYNTRAGDDFHHVKVLMLAPTGKAAYNIQGNILVSNFWQKHFKMFELHEIMRQRESKYLLTLAN